MNKWLTHSPVWLNRIFFICLAVALALINVLTGQTTAGQARQQENKLVCSAAKPRIAAKPGTIAAASIKVTNLTSEKQTYDPVLNLPEGWKQVIREFPFEIDAGGSDVRLLTFSIPSNVPEGTYEIRYSVRDHASPANDAAVKFEVVIERVVQLDLKLLQAPRFVIAGTMFASTVQITNKGNSTNTIQISCQSSYNYPIQMDSIFLTLLPKEARQLQIYVTPDGKSEKVNHILEVRAVSRQDTTIRVKISSNVEIIPRAAKLEEEYLIYPVSLRLREVGQDGKFAPQVELYGYGSLSENKKDRLEFLFRTPETYTISTLGRRDEYSISYRKDSLELYAGDQNYSLSTLTEKGRYATGIGGNGQFGRIATGAFYNSTRWTTSNQKEIGGFLSYDVTKSATLGINYLNKQEQYSSNILSLQGRFKPIAGTTIELEYGAGEKDDKRDDAYSALLSGSQRWIMYDLRFVHAGPNFGGYYQDIDFLSSSINLQPVRKVRVESYLRLENRNLLDDTSKIYTPRDVSYQIGAGYSNYISIYYISNRQKDQSDSAKYKTREEAIRARIGYEFSFANIDLSMDFGKTRDELLTKESPYRRFALSASFNPFSKQNYSTSLEYATSIDPYTGDDQKRFSANLSAWILFGESTQAQMNIYGSRLIASIEQTYSMFEGSIEHVLPFNHKISLRARLINITPSITNSEVAYFVEYAIPIGVPIKRITAVGQLRGSVIDEQEKGLANVMINIGENTALSDKNGAFTFASLKPGPAYLTVDRASIGYDRVTTQPVPIELLIEGGKESKILLQITRSVTIAGQVILFTAKDQGFLDTSTTLVEMGGRSGIFLEISNGIEMHRRVSDTKGRFLFNDLRPGQWILKVIGGDIPEYYNIIPETMKIELSPGQKTEITIQLKPRRRTIRMLEGNLSVPPQLTPKPEKPVNVSASQLAVTPKAEKQANVKPSSSISGEIKKKESAASTTLPHKPCMITYVEKRKGYILQISSWVTKSKADKVAKIMDNIEGLRTYKQSANIPSIGKRYRVYIGDFKTREEAMEFCYSFDFDF